MQRSTASFSAGWNKHAAPYEHEGCIQLSPNKRKKMLAPDPPSSMSTIPVPRANIPFLICALMAYNLCAHHSGWLKRSALSHLQGVGTAIIAQLVWGSRWKSFTPVIRQVQLHIIVLLRLNRSWIYEDQGRMFDATQRGTHALNVQACPLHSSWRCGLSEMKCDCVLHCALFCSCQHQHWATAFRQTQQTYQKHISTTWSFIIPAEVS